MRFRGVGRRSWWLVVTGVAAVATGGVGVPASAAPATSSVSGSAAAATELTLVTGDRLTVSGRSYLLHTVTGGGAGSYDMNGDRHIVPAVARPFLGRQLDQSLFDVSALVRAGGTGRVPVSLTFAAGSVPTAPPGVSLTAVDGSTADGFVTSGTAFAAALRSAIGADVSAGRPAGTTPPAPGLTGMRLAGAVPKVAQPRYPMHPLQVNVTDPAGQPATVGIALFDNDDFDRQSQSILVTDGVGRINVPAGDYTIIAEFQNYNTNGDLVDTHMVELNDVTVADTGTSTVTLDGRTATSRISVNTPRPATPAMLLAAYVRQDATGKSILFEPATSGEPLYVNAQPAAKVGLLHYVVQWSALATNPADAYRYDVAFAADHVSANQTYVARPNQLAVVHQHFSADPAAKGAPGQFYSSAVDPVMGDGSVFLYPSPTQAMPGDETEYMGTADGGQWRQASATAGLAGVYYGDTSTFRAGREYSVNWHHGPLGSGFGWHHGVNTCVACVAGSTLSLRFYPFVDSESHVQPWLLRGATTHFVLYRDGTVIADLPTGNDGADLSDIPAEPSTYRAVYDLDYSQAPGFSQSTVGHTDLTFPYTPKGDPGSALPAADTCPGQTASTPCRILPVLNLGYDLASDENNTSDLAVQRMNLRVGHLSYDGAGSHAAITSAAVAVSFDGGSTWLPANVSGGRDGCYQVTWPNPASTGGTSPTLKVTATDAIGGSITQTITNAYTIAGAR